MRFLKPTTYFIAILALYICIGLFSRAEAAFTARVEEYGDSASTSSLAVGVPGSTAKGDILFLWAGVYNTSSYVINSIDASWNLISSYTTNSDKYYLYYKIAANDEPTSYTVGTSGATALRLVMSAYTSGDFNPNNPIAAFSTLTYRTSNTAVQASTSAPTANSPLVFWGGMYTTTVRTFTKPSLPTTGWVENDDAGSTGSDFSLEVASMIWAGTGATGTMKAFASASSTTKHGFSVALNSNIDFVSIIDPNSGTGTDFSSLSVWESTVQSDLTSAATQVFSGAKTGTINDGVTVYLCRSGTYQTHSGTAKHAGASQILVTSITGAAVEQANDIWYTANNCTGGYFTISDGGHKANAVASVRSSGTSPDTTAVTILGWTTSATNYIKIWTDPSLGNRHAGKWDDMKYRMVLAVSGTTIGIDIQEEYVKIDGLQVEYSNSDADYISAMRYVASNTSNLLEISNSIFRKGATSYVSEFLYVSNWDEKVKIWNSIFYGQNVAGRGALNLEADGGYLYANNNTFLNNNSGIIEGGTLTNNVIAKNNLFKGNTADASGTFGAGTGYNATNNASIGYTVTGGAVGDRTSQTISFVDETNKDFHLSPTDTAAKGYGTNLYADTNLAVTTDIDNSGRPSLVDPMAVADNFNRANTSPIGGNWSTAPTVGAFKILSNQAVGSVAGNYNAAFWNAKTFNANQYSQAVKQGVEGGPAVRIRTSTQWDMYVLWDNSGYELARVVNGASTQLATYTEPNPGVLVMLTAEDIGSSVVLRVYFDGVKQGSDITDSSGSRLTSGQPGIYTYDTTAWDDWSGGNVNPWDIGADQTTTQIYRSVAPGVSSALASGTGPTTNRLNISSSTATFNTAPGSNIGVGDALEYDDDNDGDIDANDSIAFITGRTSSTVYTIKKYDGTDPTIPSAANEVHWNINRAYTSLANAESGIESTVIDSDLRNFDDWTAGGDATTDDVGKNIVASNEIWNIAAYANDTAPDTTTATLQQWQTGVANYIKIYTPTATTEVGTSQRHAGKWDSTKYKMEETNGYGIINYEYVKIEGLQIKIIAINTNDLKAIDLNTFDQAWISSNIIRGDMQGTSSSCFGIGTIFDAMAQPYVWNNLIYDFTAGEGIHDWNGGVFVNNTIINSNTNFYFGGGEPLMVANNIAQTCTTDCYYLNSGSYDGDDDYNISSMEDAPGAHSKNTTTVSFVNAASNDFHLSSSDTFARNAGIDLSANAKLAFSNDIDGQTRPSPDSSIWDIGADEGLPPIRIYRSVGAGVTTPLAIGAGNYLNISGSTATFNTAPGDTIGVGDALEYDDDNNGTIDASDSIAFITGRTSSTSYTVKKADGSDPTIPSGANEVHWNINRAYTSLANAESGTESTVIDSDLRDFDTWSGGKDLFASGEQWNIAAYGNGTTADTTPTTIDGWTTGTENYIKIYTPTATTEVGVSQRHQGKWDDTKYRLDITTGRALRIAENYVRVSGLQMATSDSLAVVQDGVASGAGAVYIENNIIVSKSTTGDAPNRGIYIFDGSATLNWYIYNNIIYSNYASVSSADGIDINAYGQPIYFYNNTVNNYTYGIGVSAGPAVAKNNIFTGCTTAAIGTFSAGSGYNATNNASMGYTVTGGAVGDRTSQTFTFVDASSKNFHLSSGDTAAKNYGLNLFGTNYSDNFNRSDTNPIGGSWATVPGEGALQIVGQKITAGTSSPYGDFGAYWSANTFSDNQFSQATLQSAPIGTPWWGVAVRVSPSLDRHYSFQVADSTYARVYKKIAGTWTQLGLDYIVTTQIGDVIRVEVSGSTITPYLNGVALASRTDTDIPSGYPGMVFGDEYLDDWSGGSLGDSFFTTDIDGQTRPQGTAWDIGADEALGNPVNINRKVQFKAGTKFNAIQ